MRLRDAVRAAVRDEWDGLERISRDVRPADLVTFINALLGIIGMAWAGLGHPEAAVALVLMGVIVDGMDGFVARRTGGGPLGGVLDTLADALTFVAAPALLVFFFLDSAGEPRPVTGVVLGLFVLCGLLRLARFEALRLDHPRDYFSGLSSPGAALTTTSTLLVGVPAWAILTVATCTALLMISRIRFPRLRGGLGVSAVSVILLVLATWTTAWHVRTTWIMMGFMVVYVLAGPFYVLARFGPTEAS